jgi:hypothetical protein
MGLSQDRKDRRWAWALSVPIIIFAALALVWVIGTWYPPAPSGEETTSVELRNPVAKAKTVNGEDYWDVSVEISRITPKDERIYWHDLRVTVRSANDRMLLANALVQKDSPAEYDDGSDGWVDAQVWYVCTPPHNPYIPAGSSLQLTGLSKDFEGGEVKVSRSGEEIGSFTIPPLTV